MRPGRQDPTLARQTIETRHLVATIATQGYVSGVASLFDRRTGARDLGFGLDIVDFLLEPDPEPDRGPIPASQYPYGPGDPVHGPAEARGGLVRVADRQLRKLDVF